jgi:hypothetical protein
MSAEKRCFGLLAKAKRDKGGATNSSSPYLTHVIWEFEPGPLLLARLRREVGDALVKYRVPLSKIRSSKH